MARKPVQKKSGASKAKKNAPKSKRTYRPYIKRVVKAVAPGNWRISKKAMSICNSFATDIFDRVATESVGLMKHSGKRTLSAKVVQAALRLVLPGELSKHAMQAGAKAVSRV
jgi:histone H2B